MQERRKKNGDKVDEDGEQGRGERMLQLVICIYGMWRRKRERKRHIAKGAEQITE